MVLRAPAPQQRSKKGLIAGSGFEVPLAAPVVVTRVRDP